MCILRSCELRLQRPPTKQLGETSSFTQHGNGVGVERGRCLQVTSTFLLRDLCASSLDTCVVPTRLSHCMIITQHGNGVGVERGRCLQVTY